MQHCLWYCTNILMYRHSLHRVYHGPSLMCKVIYRENVYIWHNTWCRANRPTAVSDREREKKSLLSTDLGLFRGLSRRPRATRGPGGGLASTGGKTGAPLDFSFFFDVFSFLSFSVLVGVVGPAVSWCFPTWGALSFSLSPGASRVELVGLDLEAGEEMSLHTQWCG